MIMLGRITPENWIDFIEKEYRQGVKRNGEESIEAYKESWNQCQEGLEMYPGNKKLQKEREKLAFWFDTFDIKVSRN